MTLIVTDKGDRLMVERAAAGAPEALAALYHDHASDVYHAAFRLTQSTADAEDVVQDVFLGLPRALQTYAARGSFAGWLRRLAVRCALMRLRSRARKREDPLEIAPESLRARDAAPVERVAIQRALAQLPQAVRVVFVLKVVEGYDHEEISELLGITPELSRVRLFRARRQLQRLLS